MLVENDTDNLKKQLIKYNNLILVHYIQILNAINTSIYKYRTMIVITTISTVYTCHLKALEKLFKLSNSLSR